MREVAMELKKLKGNTNWIRGGTNTGVYVFEDNTALLIDVGLGGDRPEKLIKILEENNIVPSHIICTHEHEDHVGGNKQIRDRYPDIKIYASKKSRVYIENIEIYMDFLVGGRRSGLVVDAIASYMDESKVDITIYPDQVLTINGHDFKIFDCSGHTEGSIGIVTDDGVAFFSDLMVTDNSLDKFDFLFMCDYSAQMKSLASLAYLDFDRGVLGHSSRVFTKDEIMVIADYNYKNLLAILEFLMNSIEEPKTFDELIKVFIDSKNWPTNYIAYLEYRNSLNAAISYLLDSEIIDYTLDDNIMKFKMKNI